MSHSYEWWKEEQRFIESINPTSPSQSFNYQRDVFASYCDMQANSAERDGFPLIAYDIRQVRDIARGINEETVR